MNALNHAANHVALTRELSRSNTINDEPVSSYTPQ